MRHTKRLFTGLPFMVLVGSVLLLAGTSGNAKKTTLIAGTGSFVAVLTRTVETLNLPCVQLVSSDGTIEFSGLIVTPGSGSVGGSRALRDACAAPVQGTTASSFTLVGATVSGKTGDLILEATGVFEGEPTIAPGVRTRLHFTIRGVSGGLNGATGTGQVVGQTTAFPGEPASSHGTYYAEISLPN